MGLCDFDVPTHLPIVFDLQRRNAQFFPQTKFELGEPSLTFRGHLAQLIHLFIHPRAQQATVPKAKGGRIVERILNGLHHFAELVQTFTEVHQQRVLAVLAPLNEARHAFKRMGRGHQVACVAALVSQLGGEPLHVPYALE